MHEQCISRLIEPLCSRALRGRDTNTSTSTGRGRQASPGFVGDYKQGETPVPIPNTEVKTLLPMILLSGKVGHCRLDGPCQGNLAGPFVFLPSARIAHAAPRALFAAVPQMGTRLHALSV